MAGIDVRIPSIATKSLRHRELQSPIGQFPARTDSS